MIWTRPKQIGPIQNHWYSTKMIWTVQNNFGLIEGQGINVMPKEKYKSNTKPLSQASWNWLLQVYKVQVQRKDV